MVFPERYTLLAWPDLHGTCGPKENPRRGPWAVAGRVRVVACVYTGTLVDSAFTAFQGSKNIQILLVI